MSKNIEELEGEQRKVREKLGELSAFRIGSLFHRMRKCGKKSCACAAAEHPGHGCWVAQKRVGAKTVVSMVPAQAVEKVRKELAEGERFWELCSALAEVTDNLSREKLRGSAEPQTEKKSSRKTLTGKSRAK